MPDQAHTILVVDDEPDLEALVRQRMRRDIRAGRYEFLFAHNGFEALQQIEQHPEIELVLTDINMPQMDGLTLLDNISKLEAELRSVVISAYGDMQNIRTAMNRGAFDFIIKPVDFSDLRLTIDRTVENLMAWRQALAAQNQLVLIQNELQVAAEMQSSILPITFPKQDTYELFASMVPAKEVGGDFYDFYEFEDGRLGVVVADVSGKGVPAALFMMVSRTLMKGASENFTSPAETLTQVNRLLTADNPNMMFVTLIYGIYDPKTQVLTYSNGGHNPILLVHRDRTTDVINPSDGIALGLVDDFEFIDHDLQLNANDLVLLYSDGVTEAEALDQEQFEMDRFRGIFHQTAYASAQAANDAVNDAVHVFTQGNEQSDDITCMTLFIQDN